MFERDVTWRFLGAKEWIKLGYVTFSFFSSDLVSICVRRAEGANSLRYEFSACDIQINLAFVEQKCLMR